MSRDLDLDDDDEDAAAGIGHNSSTDEPDDYSVTAAELRQFIERIEHLEGEKKDFSDQIKEVYSEAKGRGYDVKVMRRVVAMRKRDRDSIVEENAILGIYLPALGMDDLL